MIAASVTMSYSQDYRQNLQKAAEAVKLAVEREPDTRLVVFGEMITGWYHPGVEQSTPIPADKLAFPELCQTAAEKGVNIVFGISELSGSGKHNSLVLLNSCGEIASVHRKRNLKKSEIEAGYTPGSSPVTYAQIEGLKVGMVICSDAADPETVKALMKSSQDLIILILADDKDRNRFMARINARLYNSWIVTANRFGWEGKRFWDGHSVISDPRGRIRAYSVGKESMLFHRISSFGEPSLLRKLYVRSPIPFIILRNLKGLMTYFQVISLSSIF